MERTIQLDMDTINKTQPSYIRVKVLVDLKIDLPSHVEIEVVNNNSNTFGIVLIKVEYDILLKYCKTFKLQRHAKNDC